MSSRQTRLLTTFFFVSSAFVGFALIVWMALRLMPAPPAKLHFVPQSFDSLPGWAADDQAAALQTFLVSCTRMETKPQTLNDSERAGWLEVCTAARAVPPDDKIAARHFFEREFTAYAIRLGRDEDGLLTGYYEPELRGSRSPSAIYATPLYRLPPDLVTADLGAFNPDYKGKTLTGRLLGNRILPYFDRADIAAGALAGQHLELLWVDDPVSAFFLEVQGSGRVVLEDGSLVRVGYAGKNGLPYTAIGRVLIDRGAISREDVSLFTIRDWLNAHPDEAADLLNENRSYVFFRELDGPVGNAIGSEGTELTPGRSLAVDRKLFPMGVPIYISGQLPEGGGPLDRLMVAQDTGGAITGPMRGDVFWGPGGEAEFLAGHMKDKARFFLLWPRVLPARS
ncbi:murein transglycosylase A [Govanella unica]|uniref:peptidoglycan lytic exotransglycosylase n=1 Tax=Govanella unica TaxID=2975056 RepID=A0A9X3TV54_9PROT|nr:MltA domain-containing protein [Govania unica]MDA5192370.1 MltA domain-containing protein [Govania unica]